MVKVNYKYVPHGEKFTFEGKEYTKASHGRGQRFEGGRVVLRNFKQLKVVDTLESHWDVVPKLRGTDA